MIKFYDPRSMIHGFTLIEVITSVGIFALLVVGILALVSAILTQSSKQSTLLDDNDQARKVAFNLINQLRNAQTSASGAYALDTAANQQLIFYTNTGSEVDRINYFIQNGKLMEGVVKPSGNPAVYNLASETDTAVQNDLVTSVQLFYYYDGSYDGVNGTPLTQPVNVTQVKFVKVNLTVYNKGGLSTTNSFTVTAGGTMRSLKTNLGS
jgi:type II secretory pathway component PulJ